MKSVERVIKNVTNAGALLAHLLLLSLGAILPPEPLRGTTYSEISNPSCRAPPSLPSDHKGVEELNNYFVRILTSTG